MSQVDEFHYHDIWVDGRKYRVAHPTAPADCDQCASKKPGRVRIWDKDWNCLVDEQAGEGDTPSDVINRAIEHLA